MRDSIKLTLHPELSYKFYAVGSEQTPILVIDNFIQDAQVLVDFCATGGGFSKVDNFYPGLRMAAPANYIHAINQYLAELLNNIFALPQAKIAGGKSLYSMVVTPPDQLEINQCLPHIDSYMSGDLACVHFLCGKEQGGTSLYRHRKTGLEKITSATVDAYKQAVVDEGALVMAKKSYMNGSNNYFEQIASVDAQFNRMILYPSNILHSGNIAEDFAFDPNPASGRLTLNSFIYSKR
jgi:hypothetical protein